MISRIITGITLTYIYVPRKSIGNKIDGLFFLIVKKIGIYKKYKEIFKHGGM